MKLADLIQRYYFVEHTMNFLSFTCGGLVVFVLIKNSPASFGMFKYLMINVTASEILYMVFAYYIYQPVPLFPSYSGICLGPINYLGSEACYYSLLVFVAMLGYSIVSLTICFVYRYSLIAPVWIARYLSHNFIRILIFIIMCSAIGVPIITLIFPIDDAQNVKTQLLQSRPEWSTEIDNYTYFGAKQSIFIYLFMASLVTLLFLNTIICLSFTYLIHIELRKHKAIMSKSTFQMHRTLINILLAQTLIPLAFISFPILLVIYLVITHNIDDALMHIAHAPLAMYPFINSCLFLRFSPPHREAIADLFWSLICRKQRTRVSTVKSLTVTRLSQSRI